MKIQSWTGNWGYSGSIKPKNEGGSGDQYRSSDEKKKNPEQGQEFSQGDFQDEEPTPEKLIEAVKNFEADAQTQLNRLNASVEGQGPGLRVVLKDDQGRVVRLFTGSEFMNLRTGPFKQGPSPGKILDRKL